MQKGCRNSHAHAPGKIAGVRIRPLLALPRGFFCLLGLALAVGRDPARRAVSSISSCSVARCKAGKRARGRFPRPEVGVPDAVPAQKRLQPLLRHLRRPLAFVHGHFEFVQKTPQSMRAALGSLRSSSTALLHARTKAKSASRALLVQRALSVPGRIRPEHNRFHNRRETDFLLYEVEQIQDPEGDCAAVLDSVENFIGEWHHLDPLLDKHPPQFVPAERTADGRNAVVVSEDTKRLISAYQDVGFSQLDQLGLPFAVQCCAAAMIGGAFSSNPFGVFTLTRCAADLLEAHGSERLKQKYLPNMRSGKWMGTMALSEPQAGSSLASIRTIATPYAGPNAEEGEFRICGNKMWTSGAFHDLTENIVHMLLARTPGAPPGSRGISLFLVPNKLADGRHNDVEVISLNKKMGHRALSNCAWVLGERAGGAVGYLVGKENEGLQNMFFMMNAMRIEVGLSAASLGLRGFLESLVYAQHREQGGQMILEYADVKRMLLLQVYSRSRLPVE